MSRYRSVMRRRAQENRSNCVKKRILTFLVKVRHLVIMCLSDYHSVCGAHLRVFLLCWTVFFHITMKIIFFSFFQFLTFWVIFNILGHFVYFFDQNFSERPEILR